MHKMVTTRRSRTEQTVANRSAVLAAAGVVFRERGYAAATLEQFASKADLFLHVLDERIAQRAAVNDAALDRVDSTDPDSIIGALNDSLSHDPGWRLAVTEFRIAAARDPELRRRYDESHRRTVERLAALLEVIFERTGHAPAVPVEDLAATMLALDVGVELEGVSTLHPIPAESLAMLMRRLVFGT
jgi:AcrR family transcriptional regulator